MGVAKLDAGLLARKGRAVPLTAHHDVASSFWPDFSSQIRSEATGQEPKVRKSLKLTRVAHRKLRLLAARQNVSQQMLMEYAVLQLLKEAQRDGACICRETLEREASD